MLLADSLPFQVGGEKGKERKRKKKREVVLSRGYMLFLLTPARMVMAAARPMRSSFRLGWRI